MGDHCRRLAKSRGQCHKVKSPGLRRPVIQGSVFPDRSTILGVANSTSDKGQRPLSSLKRKEKRPLWQEGTTCPWGSLCCRLRPSIDFLNQKHSSVPSQLFFSHLERPVFVSTQHQLLACLQPLTNMLQGRERQSSPIFSPASNLSRL